MTHHLPTPTTLDWGGLTGPGPQTESASERGFPSDADDRNLGHSDELDDDNVGDIADEGSGHRG